MAGARVREFGAFLRTLVTPMVLLALAAFALREPILWWLKGEEIYDREAVKEWVREARVSTTLPELIAGFVRTAQARSDKIKRQNQPLEPADKVTHALAREEIEEHLKAMGVPATRVYPNQLPLFPLIYQIRVRFTDDARKRIDPSLSMDDIVWDSQVQRRLNQYNVLELDTIADIDGSPRNVAVVAVQYHLHAYQQRQTQERLDATRRLFLSGLGLLFTFVLLVWVYVSQRRERRQQQRQLEAEQRLHLAERKHFDEEMRRREAEGKQQEAEKQTLELQSQLFANIGIMAGSYAHNIKNLLVRPNDLLRRCIDEAPGAEQQKQMLDEVKHTLGTVTERLQQILQTVRRDPSQSVRATLDLNALVKELHRTWADLGREKWKLNLECNLAEDDAATLPIVGDRSHLQQALENLVFNARDATFEMRNQLREQARRESAEAPADSVKKQAIIAAAGWRGRIVLRTRREGGSAILEVEDNGIGMTEDVLRRCTETHFSTKRNNALFAGMSAGMGLGLSFVSVILAHHGASMMIESQPKKGAIFRIAFRLARPEA